MLGSITLPPASLQSTLLADIEAEPFQPDKAEQTRNKRRCLNNTEPNQHRSLFQDAGWKYPPDM
eukprot:959847-Heterocapsa_arctica.AAC.1